MSASVQPRKKWNTMPTLKPNSWKSPLDVDMGMGYCMYRQGERADYHKLPKII